MRTPLAPPPIMTKCFAEGPVKLIAHPSSRLPWTVPQHARAQGGGTTQVERRDTPCHIFGAMTGSLRACGNLTTHIITSIPFRQGDEKPSFFLICGSEGQKSR